MSAGSGTSSRRAYTLLRPLLFRLGPEQIHFWTLQALRMAGATQVGRRWLRWAFDGRQELRVEAFGLSFRNPLGLAAGYDKGGEAVRALACLGFGHIEVGTVTPQPQPGNPRPRVFRLIEDEALVNRMGFPSAGAEAMRKHLSRLPARRDFVVGVNLGKARGTPLDEAAGDYVALLHELYPYGDYFVINVSSPNTPGLRRLQSRDSLERLLASLKSERARLSQSSGVARPLLVKLAPDLTWEELDDALAALQRFEIAGVIATNTSTARTGLRSSWAGEVGGLSGRPLRERSTAVVDYIHRHTQGQLPIVAAGGVASARDAREKLEAGACLVQIFTGLVYRGPGLARSILRDLIAERRAELGPARR
ncbi:MAG: quinone-dependent dihydroorotate dehydrogenase [Anaerolineales bacterium]|jgi:dihydroorotate dehydrogenase